MCDLTGERFERLYVEERLDKDKAPSSISPYRCKCKCGNYVVVPYKYLVNGHKKSCGCLQREQQKYGQIHDLTGKTFDRLKVLKLDESSLGQGSRIKWICQCECGNVVSVFANNLIRGNTRSCGCLQKETMAQTWQNNTLDLRNRKFDRLRVIEPYTGPNHLKYGGNLWVCHCDCGNDCIVETSNLMNGHTRSCGCLLDEARMTHGLTRTKHGKRLSGIHGAMIRRCYAPTCNGYNAYGGRGIIVCDEWYMPGVEGNPGFVNFYNWSMANGYKNKLTLDRKDNDGPYAPWNCRWVTTKFQANNKRNNVHITDLDGEVLTLALFEDKYGWPRGRANHLLRYSSRNELIYIAQHPELQFRKVRGRLVDQNGFSHLVPRYDRSDYIGNKV